MDSILSEYLREISRTPLLTKEQEIRLATRAEQGDQGAKKAMVKANLRLVVHIVKKLRLRNEDLLDAIQEGNLGLFRAVEHFRTKHKTRFSTYAFHWIRQAVYRFVKTNNIIHIPENKVDALIRMKRKGFEDHEIPPHLLPAISIDQLIGEKARGQSQRSLADFLVDESPSPDENANDELNVELIKKMMSRLSARDQYVISNRFGIGDGLHPMTLEDIGKSMGISRERVRQLESKALAKLKQYLIQEGVRA